LVERLSKNLPLNAIMDQKTFYGAARMDILTTPLLKRAKAHHIVSRKPQLEADIICQVMKVFHSFNRWEREPNGRQ